MFSLLAEPSGSDIFPSRRSLRCSDSSHRIISPIDRSGRWLIHGLLLLLLLFLLPLLLLTPPSSFCHPLSLLPSAPSPPSAPLCFAGVFSRCYLWTPAAPAHWLSICPLVCLRLCVCVVLSHTEPDNRDVKRYATWRLNGAFQVGVCTSYASASSDTSAVTLQMFGAVKTHGMQRRSAGSQQRDEVPFKHRTNNNCGLSDSHLQLTSAVSESLKRIVSRCLLTEVIFCVSSKTHYHYFFKHSYIFACYLNTASFQLLFIKTAVFISF